MRYFLGVDGGGTKTDAVVGDETGRLLGLGHAGPANHAVAGLEGAAQAVRQAIAPALKEAGLALDQIDYAVLGLAGADFPEDFENLTRAVGAALPGLRFRIVNDTWIALAGGAERNWGAVVVCGTGVNAAARNREGQEVILRGLTYEVGNRGGAVDVIRDALYAAFRAHDGLGPATALEGVVLETLGVDNYDDLARMIVHAGPEGYFLAMGLAPAVFTLASQGDQVAQDILISHGTALGESASAVIRRAGLEKEEVEVVLAGSLWRGASPLMRDQFITTLHRTAPLAWAHLPAYEPVVGGYVMALQHAGIDIHPGTSTALAASAARWGRAVRGQ